MDTKKTCDLNNTIIGLKDDKRLDAYMEEITKSCKNDDFATLFYNVCQRNDLKNSDILSKINISKSHFYDIINGKKTNPGRDKILQICIASGFTLEETQKALTRTTCGILYSKVARDSLIMFCIANNFNLIKINEMLYERNFDILN